MRERTAARAATIGATGGRSAGFMDAYLVFRIGFKLIQRLVDQGVGFLVVLASHVTNLEQRKTGDQLFGHGEQRLQVGVLDLVAPLELANDQLGVGAQPNFGGRFLRRDPERFDQPLVFGHVVGRVAQSRGVPLQTPAVAVENGNTPGGRSGVSAGAAVDRRVKPLHR